MVPNPFYVWREVKAWYASPPPENVKLMDLTQTFLFIHPACIALQSQGKTFLETDEERKVSSHAQMILLKTLQVHKGLNMRSHCQFVMTTKFLWGQNGQGNRH